MWALLVVTLALIPALAHAAPDCKEPRNALPALIRRAMRHGELQTAGEAPAVALGWAAPMKTLLFEKSEGVVVFFDVIVRPGKGEELLPMSLLIGVKENTATTMHREMFAASLRGTLESVLFLDNTKDVNGEIDGQTEEKLGPYTPRGLKAYARLLKSLCRLSARDSNQEKLAKLRESIREAEAGAGR